MEPQEGVPEFGEKASLSGPNFPGLPTKYPGELGTLAQISETSSQLVQSTYIYSRTERDSKQWCSIAAATLFFARRHRQLQRQFLVFLSATNHSFNPRILEEARWRSPNSVVGKTNHGEALTRCGGTNCPLCGPPEKPSRKEKFAPGGGGRSLIWTRGQGSTMGNLTPATPSLPGATTLNREDSCTAAKYFTASLFAAKRRIRQTDLFSEGQLPNLISAFFDT